MAPKRKVVSDQEESDGLASDEAEKPVAKKAAKAKAPAKKKDPVQPLDPNAHVNTVFPPELKFEPRADGHTRIAAWNVCGVRACEKKGFQTYVHAEDADVLLLTETKIDVDPSIAAVKDKYPFRYWGSDPKKGYAGVAALCKTEPISIVYGLPTVDAAYQAETKGRLITLEFPSHYVIIAYTPNAGAGLKNMAGKLAWNIAFEAHLRVLDKTKPIIWTGDQNCTRTPLDIRNWKTNYNKTPGVTKVEMDGLESQLMPKEGSGDEPLIDVFRHRNPELDGAYTYYSTRFECRKKGIGFRLDLSIISQRILPSVVASEIRTECYGASDHLPVILDISTPL